jgi:hypothetical protein
MRGLHAADGKYIHLHCVDRQELKQEVRGVERDGFFWLAVAIIVASAIAVTAWVVGIT